MDPGTSPAPTELRLPAFIRAHRDEILATWEAAVRELPFARELERPALLDQLPDLLEGIADLADQLACGRRPPMIVDLAEVHALERLDAGGDLLEVVTEYGLLRDAILRAWMAATAAPRDPEGERALHQAIDSAMAVSVQRYMLARDRALQSVDRISAAALECRTLDDFLSRLLHVLRETTAAVDLAMVMLRDGDLLRVRASVGLDGEGREFTVTVGEGFAGGIAASAKPRASASAADEPDVVFPGVRARGVKGYCGVPLIESGEVVGVALMGSLTAPSFSTQDQRVFQAMTNRATAAIRMHLLREATEAARAEARLLADSIPQLAWIADAAGERVWYNKRWYEYTGTTLEDMRGSGWSLVHHPDHRERVLEKFGRHMESGEAWEDTFPLRGADGRYRWFLSRAVPIRDEEGRIVRWFGTNTDVTEPRFMTEATAILSSSLEYRQTLELVASLAVPVLGDWCAIDVGGTTRITVPQPDPPAGLPSVTAPLIARDRTLGSITFALAGSSRQFTADNVSRIEELGRRIGLAVDNAQLYEEAQRQARLREEILAIVSHDLKNPLGAVHLAASMLLEKPDGGTRKHVQAIERATIRMDHLIGDLLDMSSIHSGRLAVDRKPDDIDAILREVVDAHEPVARGAHVTLVCKANLKGVMVCVDHDRILQVLGNLIGNAIKFCRSGDTISVTAERSHEGIVICVTDTGPGIPEAELPHIFEPYWSAKRHAKKGTGLGLYISKGIVEAHGGKIWVESRRGGGATFRFTLPQA